MYNSDFQPLKEVENNRQKLDWSLQRTLAMVNYTIHTDAIKKRFIPEKLILKQTSFDYVIETDLLNMALFGKRLPNGDLKILILKAISESKLL